MRTIEQYAIVTTQPTKNDIIRRLGCIGHNLGLKAAQGYAVNNGLTKAHARAAMQLQAVTKGGL